MNSDFHFPFDLSISDDLSSARQICGASVKLLVRLAWASSSIHRETTFIIHSICGVHDTAVCVLNLLLTLMEMPPNTHTYTHTYTHAHTVCVIIREDTVASENCHRIRPLNHHHVSKLLKGLARNANGAN